MGSGKYPDCYVYFLFIFTYLFLLAIKAVEGESHPTRNGSDRTPNGGGRLGRYVEILECRRYDHVCFL